MILRLRTILRLLRLMPVLRLLRLLGTVLRPLLHLVRALLLLLRLDRARLGLAGIGLRLLRLNRATLRLGPVLAIVGVYRLTRCSIRLTRVGWLYLRPAIRFTWTIILLTGPIALLAWTILRVTRTSLGLAGTVWDGARICSLVGVRIARLSGDWPGGGDQGWASPVHVVELLAVLCSFALVLDLR
jgi:hypothetical protein